MDFDPNHKFPIEYAHSPGVRDALHEAVTAVHDVFQNIAPRDTGAMVRSTEISLTDARDGWEAVYSVPVENKRGTQYAKFVEFGTRYMAAQHNLQHALEIVEQEHR